MLIALAFRNKAPAGEFTRCLRNPNSNNHNQHAVRPCFYLAVQTSRESSIVFATADVSLRYPNPFRRSLQYEISALAESLQFVCAPIARWSIAQPLSNCYAPVANSALDQRCGRQSDALRALSTASFTGLGMSVSLPLFV